MANGSNEKPEGTELKGFPEPNGSLLPPPPKGSLDVNGSRGP